MQLQCCFNQAGLSIWDTARAYIRFIKLAKRNLYYIIMAIDGVNRRNGKCVTNAASTTDWPHLVASS